MVQAGSSGIEFQFALVNANDGTPYVTTGYISAELIISKPLSLGGTVTATLSTQAGTLTLTTSQVSWLSTAEMFPGSGVYLAQLIITYSEDSVIYGPRIAIQVAR